MLTDGVNWALSPAAMGSRDFARNTSHRCLAWLGGMIVDLRSRTLTVGAFGALAVAGVLLDHFSTFVVAGPPTSQRPRGMWP